MLEYLISYFFIFLLGSCIGSFLNCLAYRIYEKKSLKGRSFCPACKHNLCWSDLFPLFSFLLLGGKCRYCKKNISWQYPLVEFATGIVFVLVFWFFGFGAYAVINPWQMARIMFYLYIFCCLIVIFIYDLRHYLIPDIILAPAVLATIFYRLFGHWGGYGDALLSNYFSAALIAAGFFFVLWFISFGKWMGFGDVKLALLLGLLLGVENTIVALFIAFFSGSIIGIFLMTLKNKNLKSEVPFGPFLIFGTFMALFWGQQIVNWYLSLII